MSTYVAMQAWHNTVLCQLNCNLLIKTWYELCLCFLQDNMVKSNIDKKFSAHYDAVEAELKSSTVG